MAAQPKNQLFFGDNLDVLRRHIDDESVDLVYLDPPFNSSQSYNVLFKDRTGKRAAAQQHAFEDTWEWDEDTARQYRDTVETGHGKVPDVLRAFRTFLGENDLMAYIVMMTPRLVELHRVLKPTGSLYLHCDPTASHYLKVVLDAVFGGEHFRNEIIWKRTTAHSSAKRWGPVHDVLLYYAKSATVTWNAPRTEYDEAYLEKYYRYDDGDGRLYWRNSLTAAGVRNGSSGKPWRGIDVSATGQHWKFTVEKLDELDAKGQVYWPPGGKGFPQIKRYRDELKGLAITDVWTDIDRINQVAAERLGYPTQKPEALLERVIAASSNEGNVVLDPFCGCGTTVAVAQKLKRRWIGIDITHLAISLIKGRLQDAHGDAIAKTYEVIGEPTDLDGARALAVQDKFQFQAWALGLVGARTEASAKKGADRGIDGRTIFHDGRGNSHDIIYSVKGGHLKATDVRDLKGVVGREKAAIGVLISLDEPSRDMVREAATGEFFQSEWGKHPRWQLLTIEELLNGTKKVDRPPIRQSDETFKRAPKAKGKKREQGLLGLEDEE